MSDGRPEKGHTGCNGYVCCGFRWEDDELRREICYVLQHSWKMIICDGSEIVLLDGATEGIALTIDLLSYCIIDRNPLGSRTL